MSLFSKAGWFVEYAKFFTRVSDVLTYSKLRRKRFPAGRQVELAVRRPAGGTFLCRAGTSDAQVLWDVFWGRYHLPKDRLPENPVIFDLGANVGFSCVDFATRFPGARVFGVEMDRENVILARHNTRALGPDCQIVHAAIWREDGEVSYSKDDEEWGYHISDRQNREANVTVRAISIDTLMQETGVDRIDYIKMDIEGAEDAVLHPEAAWLRRTGELNIEIHAPATYEKCRDILTQAGFACERSARHKSAILARRQP